MTNPSIANIFHCEKLKAFPLRSETGQGYALSPLNIVLEVPPTVIRQEKEIKVIQISKE